MQVGIRRPPSRTQDPPHELGLPLTLTELFLCTKRPCPTHPIPGRWFSETQGRNNEVQPLLPAPPLIQAPPYLPLAPPTPSMNREAIS